MSLAVYMDVHVPAAVTEGLRRKLLDVRTAQADAAGQLSDEELLARAAADDPTVTMREYKPQMVARFTINAVPALAVLDRGKPTDRDGAPVPVWDSIHSSPIAEPAPTAGPAEVIVPLIYDRRAAARKLRKTSRKS
jgi:hypothetical protein